MSLLLFLTVKDGLIFFYKSTTRECRSFSREFHRYKSHKLSVNYVGKSGPWTWSTELGWFQ